MVTPATTEIPEQHEEAPVVADEAPVVVEEAPVVDNATDDPNRPKRRKK